MSRRSWIALGFGIVLFVLWILFSKSVVLFMGQFLIWAITGTWPEFCGK